MERVTSCTVNLTDPGKINRCNRAISATLATLLNTEDVLAIILAEIAQLQQLFVSFRIIFHIMDNFCFYESLANCAIFATFFIDEGVSVYQDLHHVPSTAQSQAKIYAAIAQFQQL